MIFTQCHTNTIFFFFFFLQCLQFMGKKKKLLFILWPVFYFDFSWENSTIHCYLHEMRSLPFFYFIFLFHFSSYFSPQCLSFYGPVQKLGLPCFNGQLWKATILKTISDLWWWCKGITRTCSQRYRHKKKLVRESCKILAQIISVCF